MGFGKRKRYDIQLGMMAQGMKIWVDIIYVHSLSTGVRSVFTKDLLKLLPCERVSCTYIQKFQEFSRQNKFWETKVLQQCQSRAKIKTVSSTLLTYNSDALQLQYRAGLVTIFEHLLFEFSKKNCIPGKRNYWHGVFTKDLPPNLLPCELFRASLRAPKYIIFGKRKCYNIKLG